LGELDIDGRVVLEPERYSVQGFGLDLPDSWKGPVAGCYEYSNVSWSSL